MQEISNSLRQRLRARPEPKVHPDPDLLTAFTEQALTPKERTQVVQHLAECSYCREIVSLSLPEVQAPPVAVQAAGRSRWWAPAYRWAAVAATVAIAATLVVEKPWRSRFERPEPATTISDNSQPAGSEKAAAAAPAVAQSASSTPASEPKANVVPLGKTEAYSASARPSHIATGSGGPAVTREDRGLRTNQTVDRSSGDVVGGVVGGLRQTPMAAPPPPSPQRVKTAQAQATPAAESSYVSKDSQQDYVNPIIVSNAAADVTSAQPKLPEAPAIKEADSSQYAADKDPRKLREAALAASEMNVPVVPPATAADQEPSAADTNLAKSGGFAYGLKSGLTKAVNTTVATVKKAASAKSPSSSASLGFAAPSAISAVADADQQTAKRASHEIHWRVTPEGRLQRSIDVGQWHQVVTQNPDIQFKVVQPHGSEVWAGGNNGTLIHSWNAGVNWSQLNVPDSSSSDITGIAIDGDNVQVKTSNGQTFVTNDHGKTWVPLEQKPQ